MKIFPVKAGILALSVSHLLDSSPRGRALGKIGDLTVLPKPLTLIDSPGRGRWHKVPEGEQGGTALAVTERARTLK